VASEAPHYEVRLHAQVRDEPSWEELSFVLLALWRRANGHDEWCLEYIDAMHGPVRDDDSFDSEEAALAAAEREFGLTRDEWCEGFPGL